MRVPKEIVLLDPTAPDDIVPDPVIVSDSPETRLLNVEILELLTILFPSYDLDPLIVTFLVVTSSSRVPPLKV